METVTKDFRALRVPAEQPVHRVLVEDRATKASKVRKDLQA